MSLQSSSCSVPLLAHHCAILVYLDKPINLSLAITPIYATPFTAVLIKEKFKEKHIDISKDLKIVELNGNILLEKFEIEYITLTHSILEPNGLRIKTPAGVILHTGDWKVDPNPLIGDEINSKRLKEIGDEGVLAMICDSTNVFSAGRSGSELDVRKNLLNIHI